MGRGLVRPTPFITELPNFDVATRVWRDQPRPLTQESGVPWLPNFGGSTVFILTPFNAERPNSA